MNGIAEPKLERAALASSAYRIRRFALRMGEVQGQGYIGQALGMADVLAVAYRHASHHRRGVARARGISCISQGQKGKAHAHYE